jgi:hypothetical protein
MRKADLKKNHEEFDGIVDWYGEFLGRVLRARIEVLAEDKREIAESVLLRLCAYWESFVEKELVDCANIDCSRLSEYVGVPLPEHLTLATCQAIVLGGRYLNWRSIGELKSLAKKVLPDHVNPFAKITSSTGKRIDEAYVIRNYLSHQSTASRRALMQMYETRHDLSRFKEPGAFLLANNNRRLVEYGRAFIRASGEMVKIIK